MIIRLYIIQLTGYFQPEGLKQNSAPEIEGFFVAVITTCILHGLCGKHGLLLWPKPHLRRGL